MIRDRWPRRVLHADMDAFYAAVEQLDDRALHGRPVIVGPPSTRGVVLTASYEARPYGVSSAMPMTRARALCPQAVVVPPRFSRYQAVSKAVMAVFRDFSPVVEPLSLDEAFLDMTGSERLLGSPEALGRRLKAAVRDATGGLTCSVGISATKFVAKVASGYAKPDGLTIVPPTEARAWLAPLPLERLWGAGPKTAARLHRLGFDTIGDIAAADPERLADRLGANGLRLHKLARAEDPRAVEPSRAAKSLGSEVTLSADTRSTDEVLFHVRRSAETVARRLRKASLGAAGVRLKLKRADFRLLCRQRRLAEPTDVADELYGAAADLLRRLEPLPPTRLVGVAAFDLTALGGDERPALIGRGGRRRDLELTLDRLAERYGRDVVTRASELVRDRGLGAGTDLDVLREIGDDDEAAS